MPLIKIHKINLALQCSTTLYDISHIVTGPLVLAPSTDIFIDDETYQGPGIYKLFSGFSSVTGITNLNIVGRSICSGVAVSGNSIVVTLN
jgi:hypothetical protein